MADLLDPIAHADGDRRVIFHADGDGFHSWIEEVLKHSTPDYQRHPFDWWEPVLRSGKYDTLAAAWTDAVAAVEWLDERMNLRPPQARP